MQLWPGQLPGSREEMLGICYSGRGLLPGAGACVSVTLAQRKWNIFSNAVVTCPDLRWPPLSLRYNEYKRKEVAGARLPEKHGEFLC